MTNPKEDEAPNPDVSPAGERDEAAGPRFAVKTQADVRRLLAPEGPTEAAASDGVPARRPGERVKILLCVWGPDFIETFTAVSLPSLLAPGNLPALAAEYPCEFVFLTRAEDWEALTATETFKALQKVCPTRLHAIDDLVMMGNYSTTITLAFTRAIRETGEDMLSTYFVFLVSDYVMADGSMGGLLRHMKSGRSGVLSGNFQVIEAETFEHFQSLVNDHACTLAIPPRELMAYALDHLHPATVANVINFPISHNSHTNRMFWRVDDDTLIGRFFLMHMLCIKPETTAFRIGASCDYSFIPEMCPSGDVAVLDDSDDYLVVELQPGAHEAGFLSPGPQEMPALARALSEWTTERHRLNAHTPVCFHAADVPPTAAAMRSESGEYLDRLLAEMAPEPQPHFGHPYWTGAVAAFVADVLHREHGDDWVFLTRRAAAGESGALFGLWRRLYWLALGKPPEVYPWHPGWRHYRPVLRRLHWALAEADHRMLVLAELATPVTDWLSKFKDQTYPAQSTRFLRRARARDKTYRAMEGTFDSAFIDLDASELHRLDALIDSAAPLLKAGGGLRVQITCAGRGLTEALAAHAHKIYRRGSLRLLESRYFRSLFGGLSRGMVMRCGRLLARAPIAAVPLVAVMAPAIGLLGLMDNLLSLSPVTARFGTPLATILRFTREQGQGAGPSVGGDQDPA